MKTIEVILKIQLLFLFFSMCAYLSKLSDWHFSKHAGYCFSNVWRGFSDLMFPIIGFDVIVIIMIVLVGIIFKWRNLLD